MSDLLRKLDSYQQEHKKQSDAAKLAQEERHQALRKAFEPIVEVINELHRLGVCLGRPGYPPWRIEKASSSSFYYHLYKPTCDLTVQVEAGDKSGEFLYTIMYDPDPGDHFRDRKNEHFQERNPADAIERLLEVVARWRVQS